MFETSSQISVGDDNMTSSLHIATEKIVDCKFDKEVSVANIFPEALFFKNIDVDSRVILYCGVLLIFMHDLLPF